MLDTPKVYTPEQVAEILQLSKNTIYELIKRGEIVAKKFGKVYRIPEGSLSFAADKLTAPPVKAKPKIRIEDIKKKAIPILKEAGATRSSLFGSFVRGENKNDSDIDILVELPRGIGLFGFVGLKQKLEDALHRKVDLVTYDAIHPRLRDRILREQVPIL